MVQFPLKYYDKRENFYFDKVLVYGLLVHLFVSFDCINFYLFLFLLVLVVDCGLRLWYSLDIPINLSNSSLIV